MAATSYLAVDCGAGSGRVIRGTLSDGRIQLNELHRFDNRILHLRGRLHWPIHSIYEEVLTGLTKGVASDKAIASCGIDTWGVDFGLLAEDGTLLDLPRSYRDPRTRGMMASFFSRVPRERVYELTGIQTIALNTLYQLESLVRFRSPQVDMAHRLLFIPDLLTYFLTGEAKTEFSFATTSQLYNPRTAAWEGELIDALGVPRHWFGEIVTPGDAIGALDGDAREAVGQALPLVAVTTHDTGSAVAAVPAEGGDWAYISSGTWSLMGIESPDPIITEVTRDLNFTNEGGVGGTFRVLKNIAGMWPLQECRRIWAARGLGGSWEALFEEAEKVPPFISLIDPDHPGLISPPDMLAAIAGLCRETGQPGPQTPAAYTRCIMESLALRYREVLEELRQLGKTDIHRIHVIGGGSQNALLCQMTADATCCDVLAGPVEATAIGNLLVQAMAAGEIKNLSALRTVVRNSFELKRYQPRETDCWEEPYRRWLVITGRK